MRALRGRALDKGDRVGDVGFILARPMRDRLQHCDAECHVLAPSFRVF
jgi:hypothetical protein